MQIKSTAQQFIILSSFKTSVYKLQLDDHHINLCDK